MRRLRVEVEQEIDGRWIAEVLDLPGVMVYAQTADEAIQRVKGLALRVLADKTEEGETPEQVGDIFAVA